MSIVSFPEKHDDRPRAEVPTNIFFIATHKIIFRLDSHIWCRNRNILIFRDIHTSRIILFIINSCSNRERRDIALAVIEHRIHIRREYRMIMVIDHHCRVGPPQESLRERRTIINLHFNFYISLARIKRKSCIPLVRNILSTSLHHIVLLPSAFSSIKKSVGKK